MDRLTKRVDDIVYMVKDGELLAPRALSGQEVRKVLLRLAEHEDKIDELLLAMNTQNAWIGSYRHALYESENNVHFMYDEYGKLYKENKQLMAESVRHGKWIPADGDDIPCDEWECTACGERRVFMYEMDEEDMNDTYLYCPNCGAKMDGKQQ